MRIILIVVVIILSGCASYSVKSELNRLIHITKDEHLKSISIKDDEFETYVEFSTKNCFQQKHGLLGVVWSDNFLRAYLDKKTGQKTFQVYVAIKHQTGQWLNPYQANYGRPLRTTETVSVGTDVDCTGSKYNGCTYFEHVVFDVEESELRRCETATENEKKTKLWRFRIKTKAGRDYDDGFSIDEVLALLETVDNYKPTKMM